MAAAIFVYVELPPSGILRSQKALRRNLEEPIMRWPPRRSPESTRLCANRSARELVETVRSVLAMR